MSRILPCARPEAMRLVGAQSLGATKYLAASMMPKQPSERSMSSNATPGPRRPGDTRGGSLRRRRRSPVAHGGSGRLPRADHAVHIPGRQPISAHVPGPRQRELLLRDRTPDLRPATGGPSSASFGASVRETRENAARAISDACVHPGEPRASRAWLDRTSGTVVVAARMSRSAIRLLTE